MLLSLESQICMKPAADCSENLATVFHVKTREYHPGSILEYQLYLGFMIVTYS
jgi:hypothetical protein